MKRWMIITIAFLGICATMGGVMSAAYLLGGFVEGVMPGLAGITNLLILMLVFVMVIATALTLAERKWSAMMQDRIGPNRATIEIGPLKGKSIAGVPHVITDVLKMLTKEAFIPTGANRFLFNLGPILSFAPVFALFAIVPVGPTLKVMDHDVAMVVAQPDFGLLYLFAIASLAVYGTSLAGWSSNNKFALLGGVRASSQMISYEVALGLSLVGMMMAFQTVSLSGPQGMSEQQMKYLWGGNFFGLDVGIQQWGILLQPIGFLGFFAAAFAETKRAPFDVPEGESEIIGYFVEYSGMQFGLFMISEFVEVVVLSGVLIAVFFGGWALPFGNEAITRALADWPIVLGGFFGMVFWIKVILLCYLQLAIRWTFPRFRYDQIQTLGWKILLPLGLVNVFLTGAVVLWDPTLHLLAIVGALEIGIVVAYTLIGMRKPAAEEAHGHGHDAHGHGAHGHDHGHAHASNDMGGVVNIHEPRDAHGHAALPAGH